MGHHHPHGHSHTHSHAPANFGKAFLIGITLNLTYVFAELIYGLMSKSLALVSDASHNFSDVISLILAYTAVLLATRKPSAKYTYGLKSTGILASLTNAVLLLIAVGIIVWEAIERLQHPEPIQGNTVILVASLGIMINFTTAMLFAKGQKGDLNVRGAFQHLMADALVSVGVVVSGIVYLYTGWTWLDPMVSLLVALVITLGTWGLLRESLRLALAGVPHGIQLDKIQNHLQKVPGVVEVHDLHVWAFGTTETALTVHLVMEVPQNSLDFHRQLRKDLHDHFGIEHVTVQVEEPGDLPCPQASPHGV
ncbi:cation diffusion facilitator family transporter [Deinococcus cellulosilyticus]|uniref:Cobalt transporter n=1 Tax=Deinococcus cellulosilyticus (strain DSM 18568 / NBRC 106333 / KACC 11606 / 5516J-15) TaxID=1223518 RepID=A0A511N1A0_DEIC1|nr:cation diffusion facilitator family transporter [Deinococcus cellulosilyticus]GEM46653.1 cobalt transporter [Deinococcus cellulosilyticus NBRC 106333 = KACC 11606]